MSSNKVLPLYISFQEVLDYPGNFALERDSLKSWIKCACFLLESNDLTVTRQYLTNHTISIILITDTQDWFDWKIEYTWEIRPRIEHGSVALTLLSLSILEPYDLCRYFINGDRIDLRFLPKDNSRTEQVEVSGTLKQDHFLDRIRDKMDQFRLSKRKDKGWVSVFCFETTTNALHRMENK